MVVFSNKVIDVKMSCHIPVELSGVGYCIATIYLNFYRSHFLVYLSRSALHCEPLS